MTLSRSRRIRPALGYAPSREVLESALGGLVPRRFSGLVAVAVDDAGPSIWSAGNWATLSSVSAQQKSIGRDDVVEPVFQIGSVTKVFTAVLLAHAAAAGDVDLDGPVEAALGTRLRVGSRPVTYRDLVTHRSGLPRVPRDLRRTVNRNDPYRTFDEARLLQAVSDAGDRVSAGGTARIRYSNFGFAVLGLALGRSMGTWWEGALQQRVLRPAGLAATGVQPDAPRAVLIDRRGRTVQPWHLSAFAPAGGLWMDVHDLSTWLSLVCEAARDGSARPNAATVGDRVVPAIRRTLEPQAKSLSAHVGMAWHLFERDGVAWHNGGVLGAASFVGVDVRHARAVAALAIGNPHNALDRAAIRALTGR